MQANRTSDKGYEAGDFTLDKGVKQEVIRKLGKIVSRSGIIDQRDELTVYESDGLSTRKCVPWLVVLPETKQQVQSIAALCRQYRVPLVARGAGTGLSGGAMPHADGILLSLARFNRILAVNSDDMTAIVQPGVTNLGITEHVRGQDMYYAPDPSSQIACTIGGNVAENAGGVHCLKYGLTVHNVLKIEVVTAEGDLVSLGSDALDSPGYDLLALINGSEGMLGIVVEVTVKLRQTPSQVRLIMAAFRSSRDAADAVTGVIAEGIIPAGLELMDKLVVGAAEDFANVGYPREAEALLLCELDGDLQEVTDNCDRLQNIFKRHQAFQVRVAETFPEREKLWKGRKSAFPAVGRLAPDYLCMDGTIPRHKLGDALEEIGELSVRYGLPVANVFHAGDGNLHPLILFDGNQSGELEKAEELGGKILEMCVRIGGTITGEHGVGVEKINQMCVQFNGAELSQFHALKASFDPTGILNPGKAIPTLNRCAEFGFMHVKGGQDKFPELERF